MRSEKIYESSFCAVSVLSQAPSKVDVLSAHQFFIKTAYRVEIATTEKEESSGDAKPECEDGKEQSGKEYPQRPALWEDEDSTSNNRALCHRFAYLGEHIRRDETVSVNGDNYRPGTRAHPGISHMGEVLRVIVKDETAEALRNLGRFVGRSIVDDEDLDGGLASLGR